MIYFTSDTHFFHDNIIKFSNRPYKSLADMHDQLINNWNSTVTHRDEVYVVGDFMWLKGGFSEDERRSLIFKLNGGIHIIPGDHDLPDDQMKRITNHSVITHNSVHIVRNKTYGDVVCCHWPLRNWPSSHWNMPHVFGHVHNNNKKDPLHIYGRSFNVGVDVWGYKPVSIKQIMEKVNTLGNNPNFIKK